MMLLRSLSHQIQKLCSPSRQQSATDSITSLVMPSSSSINPQMDSNSSSERVSISGPVYWLEVKMSSLWVFASLQLLAKLMLVISKPSVTMVWMHMVLSLPDLVTQMVTSFISPSKFSSCSSFFSCCCPSSSSNWVGVLMLERSRTWQAPTVLDSSTRVLSRLMVHPPLLNSFSQVDRSLRFSVQVLISSSMMALILEAFSIFPKVYLGTWVAKAAGRQSLAAGSSPLVMILDII